MIVYYVKRVSILSFYSILEKIIYKTYRISAQSIISVIILFEKVCLLLVAALIVTITAPPATYAADLYTEQEYVFVVNQTACPLTGDMYFTNLSSALDYAVSITYSHLTIYVCEGFYNDTFNGSYSLSNIEIIGYGDAVLNISSTLSFVNGSNIAVKDLALMGPANDYQLAFSNISGIEISSVSFEEAYGALYIENSSSITIDSILINQTHEYGVYIVESHYVNANNVNGTLAVSGGVGPERKGWSIIREKSPRLVRNSDINVKSPQSIAFLIVDSSHVVISDINISAVDIGIYTDNVEYINVTNVEITPAFMGIYMDTSRYINISSISVYGSFIYYTYGVYLYNSTMAYVENVYTVAIYIGLTLDTSSRIYVDSYMSAVDYFGEYFDSTLNSSTVNGLSIYDVYGILVSGSYNIKVLSSQLYGPYSIGIDIASTNTLVKDVALLGESYSDIGISIGGRGVHNNTIRDTLVENFTRGILISTSAYEITLHNVTVRECRRGIISRGGDIVINESLIVRNYIGVTVEPYNVNMSNLAIKDNYIGVNITAPYYSVIGTPLIFKDSMIANNSYIGVLASMNISYTTLYQPLVLENLNIVDNGEAGNSSTAGLFISAYAYGYPDPDLAPNIVSITHCRIVDNKYYGVVFNYSRYVEMYLTGVRSNYIGLMADHSDYLRLSNNVIVDNELDDVVTYSSNITIRGSVMGSRVNEKLTIQFYGNTRLTDITEDEAIDLFGYLPAGARVLVVLFNITVDTGSWAYVRYDYTDSFLYSKDTTENLLRLAYFNPVSSEWVTITPTEHDKVANYIAYNVTSGTVYIIYGFPDPSVGGVIAELNNIVNANILLVMLGIILAISLFAKIIKKK